MAHLSRGIPLVPLSKCQLAGKALKFIPWGVHWQPPLLSAHYYIPAGSNNATFDSFLHWRQSLGFQMFIGRESALFLSFLCEYDFDVPVTEQGILDIDFYVLEVDVSADKCDHFSSEKRCPDGDDSDMRSGNK
ncbi:hypothetical protein BDP27DRAFT_1378164 [Rhodocollybia butyracea]|uniref:Uncharacterized protein n=1 Tax=Rhodocollybia butyracea TaxID=206335 RepID=A0A9P5P480_9AGAR|nr:hypothetical protein BDP27DRAFT_1378164 [Rhodocollybia butyracea]